MQTFLGCVACGTARCTLSFFQSTSTSCTQEYLSCGASEALIDLNFYLAARECKSFCSIDRARLFCERFLTLPDSAVSPCSLEKGAFSPPTLNKAASHQDRPTYLYTKLPKCHTQALALSLKPCYLHAFLQRQRLQWCCRKKFCTRCVLR